VGHRARKERTLPAKKSTRKSAKPKKSPPTPPPIDDGKKTA
jgi:hypothetical protein